MTGIKIRRRHIFIIGLAVILSIVLFRIKGAGSPPKDFALMNRAPVINPDYSDTVIPPNIAPLNFYIKEPADKYYVRIFSDKGSPILVSSKAPAVKIPVKQWKRLLSENKGNSLYFEVAARKQGGQWGKYNPIVNKIAMEDIDGFLVYRSLYPQFYRKQDLRLYQRSLADYGQKLIITTQMFKGCFNCHTFFKNSPQKFIIQARSLGEKYMILSDGGKVDLIRPKLTKAGAAYLSWHPSGDLVALTMDMDYRIVNLFSGNKAEEKLQYIDTDGNLAVYNITNNTLSGTADIARQDRIEMQPSWSADGKYLYFISAKKMPITDYDKIKYDLMRIGYDAGKNTWGALETVISSADTGLSVTFPKVSPDGKYVLFCMTDRGSLSIYRSSTDLYLMDTASGNYRKLAINSDRTDSYHSWSSNSRWFVFASKRADGIFARPYFCYMDDSGKAYKPFILPQEDPYFYDNFIRTYNVPELVSGPIGLNRFSFGKMIGAQDKIIDSVSAYSPADTQYPAGPARDDYDTGPVQGYQH